MGPRRHSRLIVYGSRAAVGPPRPVAWHRAQERPGGGLDAAAPVFCARPARGSRPRRGGRKEDLGQLVPLGFGVATFTPAAYRRHSL